MAAPQGFELEPICGRPSPQAKSRAKPSKGEGPLVTESSQEGMAAPQGFEPRYADPEYTHSSFASNDLDPSLGEV